MSLSSYAHISALIYGDVGVDHKKYKSLKSPLAAILAFCYSKQLDEFVKL